MAYEGEILTVCGAIDVDLGKAQAIAVSGSSINFCGHLLLFADGGNGGYYFHVATGDRLGGLNGFPKYMDLSGFQRYLKDNKTVLRRLPVPIPKPNDALLHLERLMSQRWTWGGVPHNCVTFVEDVVAAGGGTWASVSNCPVVATAPTIAHRVNEFLIRLESEILRVHGVPRW